jgi:hypothetical protein
MLIAEIGRDIIARRMKRVLNPRLNNILYTQDRIKQHLTIVTKKLIRFKRYQKKDLDGLDMLLQN